MQDNFELPENLRSSIMVGIRTEEQKRARVWLVVAVCIALSAIASIPALVQYAVSSLYQSSFYTYLSLVFSDPDVVGQYWREFGLTLLESLPVVGIILCLIAAFALLMSLKLFARNMRFGFTPSPVN